MGGSHHVHGRSPWHRQGDALRVSLSAKAPLSLVDLFARRRAAARYPSSLRAPPPRCKLHRRLRGGPACAACEAHHCAQTGSLTIQLLK